MKTRGQEQKQHKPSEVFTCYFREAVSDRNLQFKRRTLSTRGINTYRGCNLIFFGGPHFEKLFSVFLSQTLTFGQ